MNMFSPRPGTPTIIALTTATLLSLLTAPGFYTFSKKAGGGHKAATLYDGLQSAGYQRWSDIPDVQRGQIRQTAIRAGTNYAILMLLGQHVPISLLILFTICIMSQSTTSDFKRFSRNGFLVVSLVGVFFLSVALSYHGEGNSFGGSIGVSAVIYSVIAILLWATIGTGALIARASCRQFVDQSRTPQPKPTVRDVHLSFADGCESFQQGDYATAIDAFEKCVDIDPNLPEALYNLAFAYFHLTDYERAFEVCSRLMQTHPEYSDAQQLLAAIQKKRGEVATSCSEERNMP